MRASKARTGHRWAPSLQDGPESRGFLWDECGAGFGIHGRAHGRGFRIQHRFDLIRRGGFRQVANQGGEAHRLFNDLQNRKNGLLVHGVAPWEETRPWRTSTSWAQVWYSASPASSRRACRRHASSSAPYKATSAWFLAEGVVAGSAQWAQ